MIFLDGPQIAHGVGVLDPDRAVSSFPDGAPIDRCFHCGQALYDGEDYYISDDRAVCDGCAWDYEETLYTPEKGLRYAQEHSGQFTEWLWADLTEEQRFEALRGVMTSTEFRLALRDFLFSERGELLRMEGFV